MDIGKEQIRFIHKDCLATMKEIPEVSVDLTVTSPPYDNLRTYNGTLEWGEHVWKPVLSELYRVMKDGGVVVWIVGDATIKGSETGTSFRQALYAMECKFNLHDTMIYTKHCMPTDPRLRYYQRFEYMFVLSKGKPKAYNPIADVVSQQRNQSNGSDRQGDRLVCTKKKYKTLQMSIRGNVWPYDPRNQKINHPAVFPIKLAQDHVLSWSNEGDTVLDPFMGSGTTGVACVNTKRNFIGIEKDQTYFELAKKRIETAQYEKSNQLL